VASRSAWSHVAAVGPARVSAVVDLPEDESGAACRAVRASLVDDSGAPVGSVTVIEDMLRDAWLGGAEVEALLADIEVYINVVN